MAIPLTSVEDLASRVEDGAKVAIFKEAPRRWP